MSLYLLKTILQCVMNILNVYIQPRDANLGYRVKAKRYLVFYLPVD